jgi:hypothetical protein
MTDNISTKSNTHILCKTPEPQPLKSMNICIVVARYNENIEWTKQFSNVFIYNKGEPLIDYSNQFFLNNVGREPHTYYKHIFDNYDNLAEYTVFLQGNPFDHSPNIISNLNNYINNKELDIDFEFLSEGISSCNIKGCTHDSGLPLIETYEKIFGKKKDNNDFIFGVGAQFIVSRKKILQKPKEFYSNIVKILETNIKPIEAYVMERFHKLIFD